MSKHGSTILIAHLHQLVEKLRIIINIAQHVHHFLRISLLNLLDAIGIPRQIVKNLLTHLMYKHTNQWRVCIVESIVLLDVLDLYQVVQFI